MNPKEISDDIRNLDSMLPPQMVTNFVMAPPPVSQAPTLESLAKFFVLLNERYPIDRGVGNFNGNHSVIFDTTGLSRAQPGLTVLVWVFKQLEWRCYPVGLTDDDLRLAPEALVNEIARCLDAELTKLIVPGRFEKK